VVFSFLIGFASFVLAQETAPPPLEVASSAHPVRVEPPAKSLNTLITGTNPAWKDLTPAQQLSLAPLEKHWNTLEEINKQKWIAIAAGYATLPPSKQARLHSRMTEWASLSKQQRIQARLNFSQSKQLTPTQKTATWEAYQALSPEEKKKVATLPPHKTTEVVNASKPTPVKKLILAPVNRKSSARIIYVPPLKNSIVTNNTLLPTAPRQHIPASSPQN
jgi:hypothetical protein